MACFKLVYGYRNPHTGKIQSSPNGTAGRLEKRPCGWCRGCRIARAREWTIRVVHEASMHEKNSFVTLTYAPNNLPPGGSLKKKDAQDFMKRLRYYIEESTYGPAHAEPIRYYYCGEYGEKLGRPHYHFAIFGWDFPDKGTPFEGTHGRRNVEHYGYWQGPPKRKRPVWRSELLEKAWTAGNCEVGKLEWDSAAYIARYIHKKIAGKPGKNKNGEWIDPKTYYGEKLPEFTDMSRGSKTLGTGGIGKSWYEKNWEDIFPSDQLVIRRKNGPQLVTPPRYYLNQYEITDPDRYVNIWGKKRSKRAEKIKKKRKEKNAGKKEESPLRLHQRELHADITTQQQKRSMENGTEDLLDL